MLVNREKEINALDSHFEGFRFKIILLEGRPGIGKTTLIEEFIEKRPTLRFPSGSTGSIEQRLGIFSESVSSLYGVALEDGFKSWADAFSFLCKQVDQRRITLVFDDYPTLASANDGFENSFLRALDDLTATSFFIIASGTKQGFGSVGKIRGITPLMSTHICSLRLQSLGFFDTGIMSNETSFKKQVEHYAIFGGIPAHYCSERADSTKRDAIKFRNAALIKCEESSIEYRIIKVLACSQHPCVGEPSNKVAEKTSVKETEALQKLKELRKQGLVSRNKLRSYDNEKFKDQFLYRLSDCSDIFTYRFKEALVQESIENIKETVNFQSLYESVLLDAAKSWLWKACKTGDIPFEINDVVFCSLSKNTSDNTLGLIATNDHYKKASVCLCCYDNKAITKTRIQNFLTDASLLPYKKMHYFVFTQTPVNGELKNAFRDNKLSWICLAE